MARSTWHQMTEEQRQHHLEGEKRRRAARRAVRTDEQRAALSSSRAAARVRRMERNIDHYRAVEHEYKRNGKGYFFSWANSIKSRAVKKNLPYDLDADFLQEICPAVCPVLGIPLKRKLFREDNSAFSPTVDRIFPERGYVRDNVIIVSRRANNIKSDASPDEILKVGKYYSILCEGLK